MSTLVLEVNPIQEKVLESLLQYMNINFQKVSTEGDFWDSLSIKAKHRIEQGLADSEAGRLTPFNEYMEQLLAK